MGSSWIQTLCAAIRPARSDLSQKCGSQCSVSCSDREPSWICHSSRTLVSRCRRMHRTRPAHSVPRLPPGTSVYRQFGLGQSLVVQLLEQLPSAERCSRYSFAYHPPHQFSSWQTLVSGCSPRQVGHLVSCCESYCVSSAASSLQPFRLRPLRTFQRVSPPTSTNGHVACVASSSYWLVQHHHLD